jgi:HEAT repeat protein
MRALSDQSQPQPVREEAAESLAYSHYRPAIPVLIAVLDEGDVRMRFWAVFALGNIGQFTGDARVAPALERMLADDEAPPGNWWPVGRETRDALDRLKLSRDAQTTAR